MERTSKLAVFAGTSAILVIAAHFSTTATAQAPTPVPSVWLQNATPGTAQTGNLNISGTAKVGAFRLGNSATAGRVLTTDANGVGTWQVAGGFALPYTGTGASAGSAVFHVTNSAGDSIGGHFHSSGGASAIGLQGSAGTGIGVKGYLSLTSGTNYGGHFSVSSAGGSVGVVGQALSASGGTSGGFFTNNSATGNGAAGINNATSGAGVGVNGQSASAQGMGMYAQGGSSGTFGSAIFCNGPLIVTGSKSFQIDHPLDPENKVLRHYCTESSEPLNVYSGNVVTNVDGEAWVQLPDYFEAINKDFRYQLTVVGTFSQAVVMNEIHNNRFSIKTDKPKVKVSWRIEATRNDLYVRRFGAAVEIEKADDEKGRYLQPELFGLPNEAGLGPALKR